jgi:DNA-binding CsgD family transcriptional regulator
VLELLSKGVAPAAIADQLGISVNTCRGYLRTLMAKMGARSQREVVAFVGLHGLPD